MKLLITGSRYDSDVNIPRMYAIIKSLKPTEIIVGDAATGVDKRARIISTQLGIKPQVFYAEWDRYGLDAGPMRNTEMLKQKPDLVLAFHPAIWRSKGTRNCISQAITFKIPVKHVTANEVITIK